MYSARPSAMAARAFGPMNSARWKKWPAISGARCGPGPSHVEVDDLDVAQLGRALDEGVEQDRRRGRRALDVDLLAALDPRDGLGGRDDAHRVGV